LILFIDYLLLEVESILLKALRPERPPRHLQNRIAWAVADIDAVAVSLEVHGGFIIRYLDTAESPVRETVTVRLVDKKIHDILTLPSVS
jgi:hypothetical protein